MQDGEEKELRELFAALSPEYLASCPGPLEDLAASLNLREVSADELAAVFGISARRVQQLAEKEIIPSGKRKNRLYFPLLDAVNAYIEYLRDTK